MEAERPSRGFGERGIRLPALSAGRRCTNHVDPRVQQPKLHREVVFETPLEIAEQVPLGMRLTADAFISRLGTSIWSAPS